MSYIAGHYTGTYKAPAGSALTIGTTREGFRLRETHHSQQILTDDGGEAPVDGVQQGTEVLLSLDYVEYDSIRAVLYAANVRGQPKANVGKLLSALAGQLVLTPAAGTPAETLDVSGNSWVFYKAIIDSDIETLLASKLRQGPCTFRCYPDPATGKAYEIVTTPP
jgi:hypothetical protein